ncbi:uncharacterized protein N7473_000008 [Penicillium subrubescens]|uniref:Uncharacterized protein n=1 Tax=Penicillium subrubescens TaxID=1316194 RepID=A0A1Q5UJD2_9EURO|nr:uncharacterized protein N7473_000008 [Penicillium subrubescens]KAJ5910705.1 hypothetical protein N7473_000008 [Penicillium subrubescens]OKP12563.1 hypothetical protein PENSUB_1802 [Penicillium subrubescens]
MRHINLTLFGLTLPFVSASAEPGRTGRTVTIQLANDQSGANINEAIPGNGKKYGVRDYWGHSVLSEGGRIYATSAQLTAFQQSTVCIIEGSHVDTQLDSRKTWTFLAGGPVVDLSDATVSCRGS